VISAIVRCWVTWPCGTFTLINAFVIQFPQIHHTDGYSYGLPSNPATPRSTASSPRSAANLVWSPFDRFIDRIRVCVRKRPRTAREISMNEADVVTVQGPRSVVVAETKITVDMKKFIQQVHGQSVSFIFDSEQRVATIFLNAPFIYLLASQSASSATVNNHSI
jgi:hypothetical protein